MRSGICSLAGSLCLVFIPGCSKKDNTVVSPPELPITSISGTVFLPDSLASSVVYVGYAYGGSESRKDPSRPDVIQTSVDPGPISIVYKKLVTGTAQRNFEIATPAHSDSVFWVISWIDENGNQYPDSPSEPVRRPFKYVQIYREAVVDIGWVIGDYSLNVDIASHDTAIVGMYLRPFGNTGLLIDFN